MAKHKMVSLQRTAAESKKDNSDFVGEENKPHFPLSLHLRTAEIDKLGLSGVQVGEEHELVAKVRVTSVSINQRDGSKKRESLELTLIEGEINSDHGPDPQKQAKTLFGED